VDHGEAPRFKRGVGMRVAGLLGCTRGLAAHVQTQTCGEEGPRLTVSLAAGPG
jgi:hypothetical protein